MTVLENIANLVHRLLELPLVTQVGFLVSFCFVLSGVFLFIVCPVVFQFKIIPEIERRLGRRIERWGLLVDMTPLGKYMQAHFGLSFFAVYQYFLVKFSKNPDAAIEKFNKRRKALGGDLAKAAYDVRQASKFELIMCFLVEFFLILGGIAMLVFQFYVLPNKPV